MTATSYILRSLLLCCVLLTAASAVAAQTVTVRGRGDAENDRFLQRLIESGGYEVIASDTLLARNDTIHGTALVVGTTARLEGVITGDLVIVDANVFVRPTARIMGDVRNIAGGLYYSELAAVIGTVHSEPNASYRVDRDNGSIVIHGTTAESALVLYGFKGIQIPTYDRVDGLTASVGAGYLLPRIGDLEPIIRGRLDYRTERSEFTGGLELAAARRRHARDRLQHALDRANETSTVGGTDTVISSVSFTIVCPPPFGATPRVPADAYRFPSRRKKSRSECGLPVGIVVSSSHAAPSPPALTCDDSGPAGCARVGAGWSSRPSTRTRPRAARDWSI